MPLPISGFNSAKSKEFTSSKPFLLFTGSGAFLIFSFFAHPFPAVLGIIGAEKTGFRPSFSPILKVAIYKSLSLALSSVTYYIQILRIHSLALSPVIIVKSLSFIYIDARICFLLTKFQKKSQSSGFFRIK
jgi:hypothetical protein